MALPAREPKFPAPRPEHEPIHNHEADREVSLYQEGMDIDLFRRSFYNLSHEAKDLAELIEHVRCTAAPFTEKDLKRLDKAALLIVAGLLTMKKVIKRERRWVTTVKLDGGKNES